MGRARSRSRIWKSRTTLRRALRPACRRQKSRPEWLFPCPTCRHPQLSPSEVPYRPTSALRSPGVRWILLLPRRGSLQSRCARSTMPWCPIIHRSHPSRPISFSARGAVAHVGIAGSPLPTLCPPRANVPRSLMPPGRQLHRSGTYPHGGRPSRLRRNPNLYRSWLLVIAMNQPQQPAARKAREAYATLARHRHDTLATRNTPRTVESGLDKISAPTPRWPKQSCACCRSEFCQKAVH